MEDHVCCNLDKIKTLEERNQKLENLIESIYYYIEPLDTIDKVHIHNMLIYTFGEKRDTVE